MFGKTSSLGASATSPAAPKVGCVQPVRRIAAWAREYQRAMAAAALVERRLGDLDQAQVLKHLYR